MKSLATLSGKAIGLGCVAALDGLRTVQGIDGATFAAAQSRRDPGPVEVRATGPMDPSRVPLAQEIVTYLAAYPDPCAESKASNRWRAVYCERMPRFISEPMRIPVPGARIINEYVGLVDTFVNREE